MSSYMMANLQRGTQDASSVLHLREESPFRPIDWRWEKARLMRENPRLYGRLPKAKDEWTFKARDYQRELATTTDEYSMLTLLRRWPHLFEAHQIHQNEMQMVRWELQARILAKDSPENIQKRLCVSPTAVTWYEKLFFNVADRLDNRGYIAHNVLGESMHSGLTERDHDLLWKMYGYCGGPAVLDAVIDKHVEILRPEKADEVQAFVNDETENLFAIKGMFTARTMPINSYTQEMIMVIHQKFLELRRNAESGSGAGDSISINIQTMLENIPWTIGASPTLVSSKDPSQIIGKLPRPLAEADEWASELRASEITELNVGNTPSSLEYARKAFFPKPVEGESSHADATTH